MRKIGIPLKRIPVPSLNRIARSGNLDISSFDVLNASTEDLLVSFSSFHVLRGAPVPGQCLCNGSVQSCSGKAIELGDLHYLFSWHYYCGFAALREPIVRQVTRLSSI